MHVQNRFSQILANRDEPLTDETFLLYCSRHYDGRHCATMEDFEEDLNRLRYIKKLVTRYRTTGELKERLIMNHIMVLYNVFGAHVASRIMYFKLKDQFDVIKPFLVQLNILPEFYYNIGGEDTEPVDTEILPMDVKVITAIREMIK